MEPIMTDQSTYYTVYSCPSQWREILDEMGWDNVYKQANNRVLNLFLFTIYTVKN